MEKYEVYNDGVSSITLYGDDIIVKHPKGITMFEEDFFQFVNIDKATKTLSIIMKNGETKNIILSSGDISTIPAEESQDDMMRPMPSKEDMITKLRAMYPNISLDAIKSCLMKDSI